MTTTIIIHGVDSPLVAWQVPGDNITLPRLLRDGLRAASKSRRPRFWRAMHYVALDPDLPSELRVISEPEANELWPQIDVDTANDEIVVALDADHLLDVLSFTQYAALADGDLENLWGMRHATVQQTAQ